MLTRVLLARQLADHRERDDIAVTTHRLFGRCEVPEQCRIIVYGGAIFVRDHIDPDFFVRSEYLLFDGIDPDTICVVHHLDHEREAA